MTSRQSCRFRARAPPTGLNGILVHDRWGSYFLIPDVVHALCNSHIMRNLLAVETEDGEPWARKMRRLLLQACLAT